jgi:hypothetical protein
MSTSRATTPGDNDQPQSGTEWHGDLRANPPTALDRDRAEKRTGRLRFFFAPAVSDSTSSPDVAASPSTLARSFGAPPPPRPYAHLLAKRLVGIGPGKHVIPQPVIRRAFTILKPGISTSADEVCVGPLSGE